MVAEAGDAGRGASPRRQVRPIGMVHSSLTGPSGTPALDLKPYAPAFDSYREPREGRLSGRQRGEGRADDRFSGDP